MSQQATYILSLIDKISAPLMGISSTVSSVAQNMSGMQQKSKILKQATEDLGGSISALRQRMNLLQEEKELINPANIDGIKQCNKEISKLEKKIGKLDNAGNKKGLSKYFGDIIGIVNPVTAAIAGVGMAVKSGLNLDEQFAEINITAQLKDGAFENLKQDIISSAKKNKVDVMSAPVAFEQILSQTNDVDLSLKILDSTLKGSKAGFTDTAVVAGALAQSLSIIGKENASAEEVLDTLFAAKRVGAGEFKDFANYMPGLIAGASALSIGYKETAGVFAYMTGKGQSAERASVLMNNMFSMLGRGDVVEKLKGKGINIFDNGEIRSTIDIFQDLNKVMSTMNGEQKSNFIEEMGIVDKEAKSAFLIMSADVDKLKSSLADCANASGETDRALAYSASAAQRAQELWASFKTSLAEFGTSILPIVNVGLSVLSGILSVISPILGGVFSFFGGWFDLLAEGNPWIWGITAALGAMGIILASTKISLAGIAIRNALTAISFGGLTTAIKAMNFAFLTSPWGLAIVGITAVIAGFVAFSSKANKSTRALAEFNTELSHSKDESNEQFTAAINAAEGSDARAEAIKNINAQYSTYLPHLLSEKSSNNEIATALNIVNGELERKITNKYRDEMQSKAIEEMNNAKTDVLEFLLNQVDDNKKQQLATDFHKVWDGLSTGEIQYQKAAKFIEKKYDVSAGFNDGKFLDLRRASTKKQKAIEHIDSLIPALKPIIPVENNNGGGKGTKDGLVPTADIATTTTTASSSPFDLDLKTTNVKGSAAYNMAVAKLSPVSFATDMPNTKNATIMPSAIDSVDYNNKDKNKTLNLDKFCDKIVINIEKLDDKGEEDIREQIMNVLMEVANA